MDRVFAYLGNVFIDVGFCTALVLGSGVIKILYAFEPSSWDLGRTSLGFSDFVLLGATG
jgi:hypothetical protein